MVVVQRQPDLLEVVLALRATGRFAGLLNSREQECNEDGNNRNDHEEFNQSEPEAKDATILEHETVPEKR
jgi:hypothetical protein